MPRRPSLTSLLAAAGLVASSWHLIGVIGDEGDEAARRASLLGAIKVWGYFAIAGSFLWLRSRSVESRLRRIATSCELHPWLALALVIASVYGLILVTTPQIRFGRGLLGVGYGFDGAVYGWMTENFAWFSHEAKPPFNYRPSCRFWCTIQVLTPSSDTSSSTLQRTRVAAS